MSSQSFDESSNLVIEVTSPTETSSAGANSTDFEDTGKSNFKEKHKGGLHFIKKRAKSPFRSPLKSPIKSPFKSPKTSSKSSKADQELLTEDYKEIEKKISEKKSEEWQMFQQMQDRIKLNVLKTKSSLTKLTSESSEEQDVDMEEIKSSVGGTRADNENGCETEELLNLELQQLSVTPVTCPRGFPKPPANSLRTSMENLSESQGPADTEGDLLGLSEDADNGNLDPQPSSNAYINPDLLELDGLMSATDSPYESSMHSSFDESDMTFGSNMHSARSSARTTPLGFEQGSWIGPSTQSSAITSKFVSDLVDEFLQLDTMKEAAASVEVNPLNKTSKSNDLLDSLDPFSSISPGTANTSQTQAIASIVSPNKTAILDLTSNNTSQKQPVQDICLDPFGFDKVEVTAADPDPKEPPQEDAHEGGVPTGPPVFDPFNGCKDNTIGRSISPHVYDNFGFGLTNASDVNENSELDSIDHANIQPDSETTKECGKFENLNPFLTDENPMRMDVFEEKFLELGNNSNSSNADLAWGSQGEGSGGKHSINPFKDDIFESNTALDTTNDTKLADNNPFLDGTCEVVMNIDSTNNPFLDLDETPSQAQDLTDFGFSDVSDILVSKENSEPMAAGTKMDNFDPFRTIDETHEDFITYEKAAGLIPDAKTIGSQAVDVEAAKKNDNEDEDEDEDEDDIFKLKIKPVPADPNKPRAPVDFGPVPLLKPPPKIPKSPQPPRVNPFDRDSPPEEDFAKFEIMHEKKSDEEAVMPEQSVSFSTTISTTESVTPEEEQNLEPLEPFYPEEEKDGWKLMLRQPTKKKLTTNRFWKGVIVRLVKGEDGPVIKVFSEKDNGECYHELPLQPCYSVSDVAQQHYDQYGKIHTLKIQYIFYRERVGIKADRITPSFVKKPKATMILDHAPQVSEMMKLGSLDRNEIKSFGRAIENALMHLDAHREKTLTYVKEEVCAEVVDEYEAELDKAGILQRQKARVRVFFLAFVTGMPTCEIGLNDRRRDGLEVVGRHDIIPIKTEEWIKLEDVEFHCCVDLKEYEKTNNIKFHPLDACHFEVMRYRVRLRQNKELPLQLKIQQTLSEKKCEIRCDLLVTGYHSFSKKHGQFPCEDIEVHFPIPEQWIYLFRYEKRFRYGSFKSSTRKPGKIKGLERLTMIAQGLLTPTLMEADVGSAKYEHLNRAVVWRIPRLPERNEGNLIKSLHLILMKHFDLISSRFQWVFLLVLKGNEIVLH